MLHHGERHHRVSQSPRRKISHGKFPLPATLIFGLLGLATFFGFCVTEEFGKLLAKSYVHRRLGRAEGSMNIELEIDTITPFADICPAEYPPTHSKLHDRRDHEVHYYTASYGAMVEKLNYFMDKNYEFPDLIKYTNYKYAVWNPEFSVEAKEAESSAWEATNEGNYVDGPGLVPPRPQNENSTVIVMDGDFAAFNSWFAGNFGHFAHDWLPSIALMRHVLPKNVRLVLLDDPMSRKFLKFLDPEFHDLVVWIKYDHVYHITGDLTVHVPLGIPDPMLGCCSGWDPMRQWIAEKHPERPKEKHVVFYTRGGRDTKHGRVLDDKHEQETLEHIRSKLKQHQKPDKIIIFTGRDEETNQTLSIQQQFDIFRGAHTFIGPHGSGLGGNYLWMDPFASNCEERTKLLEFMPGPENPVIHALYAHYYGNIRKWPMDYHTLLYTSKSSFDKTFINLQDLDDALDDMWGSKVEKKNLRTAVGASVQTEEESPQVQVRQEEAQPEKTVEEHAADPPEQVPATTSSTILEEPRTEDIPSSPAEVGESPEETQGAEHLAVGPPLLTELEEETDEQHAADQREEVTTATTTIVEEPKRQDERTEERRPDETPIVAQQ